MRNMKNYINTKLFFLLFTLLLSVTVYSKVLVVYDCDAKTAGKIVTGIKSVYSEEYVLISVKDGADKVKAAKTDLVVALGIDSYKLCTANLTNSKIFFGMLSNPHSLTLSSNTIGGSSFEPDPEYFFNKLKKVFPKTAKVGVPFVPGNSQKIIDKYKAAASKYGITLVTESSESTAKIPIAIKALATKCDLIWGGPDAAIFSTVNLQIFAQTSFSKKIPVVFNSMKNIEKGGTIAILSEYSNIGIIIGKMMKEYKGSGAISGSKIKYPLKTILVVNMKTVGQLKLALPSDALKPGPTTIIIFK